jgi:hypothetical protein
MRKMTIVLFAVLPCLLFGQTQGVPTYEELNKTMDSSLAQGEPVKKPIVKKKKVKKGKKNKRNKKNLKSKKTKKKVIKKNIKNSGEVK